MGGLPFDHHFLLNHIESNVFLPDADMFQKIAENLTLCIIKKHCRQILSMPSYQNDEVMNESTLSAA
jgi:hypothetical protein